MKGHRQKSCPLIFQISVCQNWHLPELFSPRGCRGFTGLVPPPLWIRVQIMKLFLSLTILPPYLGEFNHFPLFGLYIKIF